jgi:hypothetical protein
MILRCGMASHRRAVGITVDNRLADKGDVGDGVNGSSDDNGGRRFRREKANRDKQYQPPFVHESQPRAQPYLQRCGRNIPTTTIISPSLSPGLSIKHNRDRLSATALTQSNHGLHLSNLSTGPQPVDCSDLSFPSALSGANRPISIMATTATTRPFNLASISTYPQSTSLRFGWIHGDSRSKELTDQ